MLGWLQSPTECADKRKRIASDWEFYDDQSSTHLTKTSPRRTQENEVLLRYSTHRKGLPQLENRFSTTKNHLQ